MGGASTTATMEQDIVNEVTSSTQLAEIGAKTRKYRKLSVNKACFMIRTNQPLSHGWLFGLILSGLQNIQVYHAIMLVRHIGVEVFHHLRNRH
jgi:hypothetical protein